MLTSSHLCVPPIFDAAVWGTVGDWISGIGALIAVVVAIYISRSEERRRRDADERFSAAMAPALFDDIARFLECVAGENLLFEATVEHMEAHTIDSIVNRAVRAGLPVVDAYSHELHRFPTAIAGALAKAHGAALSLRTAAEDIRMFNLALGAHSQHKDRFNRQFIQATRDIKTARRLIEDAFPACRASN